MKCEYSGRFYTSIPEIGNRRSDVKKPHFRFNGNLYSGVMETASFFLIMYVCVT